MVLTLILLRFYWYCFGELAVILRSFVFTGVHVSVLGLLQGNFQCPLGQWCVIYAPEFACTSSFTVHSVQGVLLSVTQF